MMTLGAIYSIPQPLSNEMPNYLNTQVDSAIANLLVLPNDIDPDYDTYSSIYANQNIKESTPSAERQVTVKLALGTRPKQAQVHTEKGFLLTKSTKACSTTQLAIGSSLHPSISQRTLSSDQNPQSRLSKSTPQIAQVDSRIETQPPSTKPS